MKNKFLENFNNRIKDKNIPPFCLSLDCEYSKAVDILGELKPFISCIKYNPAFVNVMNITTHIPRIIDLKLGDIPNTMIAWKNFVYNSANSTNKDYKKTLAITLNPYFGKESLEVFLNDEQTFSFIVTNPSNVKQSYKYFEFYSDILEEKENVGFVAPATDLDTLKHIRKRVKNSTLLIPGIGKQGGNIKKIINAIGKENIILVLGRSIIESENPKQQLEVFCEDWIGCS